MNENLFLDGMLANLYRKALDRNVDINFPIKVIDEPDVAHEVLKNPEIFQKNYYFLESFSIGRLSANSDDWKLRASLTQALLARYDEKITEKVIEGIYVKHLRAHFIEESNDLFQSFVNAAMEVIFLIFGLPKDAPWPAALTSQIRQILNQQQALEWGLGSRDQYLNNRIKLQSLLNDIQNAWRTNPQMVIFLNDLQERSGSALFDPVGELVQVFQAASETTASTLMWMVECLLRYPNERLQLQEVRDSKVEIIFIKEVLRLFPALPFMTRVALEDIQLGAIDIQRGEVILVSIIGLHCHPNYWITPGQFQFKRSEFLNGGFEKKAYIPFLSGPRACGGMRLANQELSSALKVILNMCQFSEYNEPLKISYGVTSRPANRLETYLNCI